MSDNAHHTEKQLEQLLTVALDRGGFPPLPEPMAPGFHYFFGESALLLVEAWGRKLYLRADGRLSWLEWVAIDAYHPQLGTISGEPRWSVTSVAQLEPEHCTEAVKTLEAILKKRTE